MAASKPSDDRPTTVTCFACGGSYEKRFESGGAYRVETCRWCTEGRMTAAEIARWHARKQGR